jgi:Flp pilus assembly pilin Flp
MLNFIKNFRNDEDGAVTVDWVVLTAAIVGLGIAVLTSVGGSAVTTADAAGAKILTAGEIDFAAE